jgi:flagellar hook-length control protein FliK
VSPLAVPSTAPAPAPTPSVHAATPGSADDFGAAMSAAASERRPASAPDASTPSRDAAPARGSSGPRADRHGRDEEHAPRDHAAGSPDRASASGPVAGTGVGDGSATSPLRDPAAPAAVPVPPTLVASLAAAADATPASALPGVAPAAVSVQDVAAAPATAQLAGLPEGASGAATATAQLAGLPEGASVAATVARPRIGGTAAPLPTRDPTPDAPGRISRTAATSPPTVSTTGTATGANPGAGASTATLPLRTSGTPTTTPPTTPATSSQPAATAPTVSSPEPATPTTATATAGAAPSLQTIAPAVRRAATDPVVRTTTTTVDARAAEPAAAGAPRPTTVVVDAAQPVDPAVQPTVPAVGPGVQPSGSAVSVAPSTPSAPTQQPAPLQQQLARPIFTLAAAGHGQHTVTVTVAPEALGEVTVRAHVTAQGMHVEMFAASDAGRDAVRAIMPDLRRDMSQTGVSTTLDLSNQNQPSDTGRQAPDRSAAGLPSSGRSGSPGLEARPASRTPAPARQTTGLDVLA